jgi:hypothetical protein
MIRKNLLAAMTFALAVAVVGARANASTIAAADVSTNWAGYAVSAASTTFTSVTGKSQR